MEDTQKNNSTYGAIFAMILIVLIVIGMAYNAIKKILSDRKEMQEEQAQKSIVVEGLPGGEYSKPQGTILYENLTDEEATQIIKTLLQSGEKNQEELEKLKTEILTEKTEE
ncbi:MAG: hypothetical protein OXB96_02675 [Candidatus Kaiserbacteria bacterium]|nr:hypothetical protein [Candidatus Kaiserbacteria bacterium]